MASTVNSGLQPLVKLTRQAIVDLVNDTNRFGKPLKLTDVTMSVAALDGNHADAQNPALLANTTLTLTATRSGSYSGTKNINYRRVDIADIAAMLKNYCAVPETCSTVRPAILSFFLNHGIEMDAESFEDSAITWNEDGTGSFTLTAVSDDVVFTGTADFTTIKLKRDMATGFTSDRIQGPQLVYRDINSSNWNKPNAELILWPYDFTANAADLAKLNVGDPVTEETLQGYINTAYNKPDNQNIDVLPYSKLEVEYNGLASSIEGSNPKFKNVVSLKSTDTGSTSWQGSLLLHYNDK